MRTIGTVKWFNDAKGFGFITPEPGAKGPAASNVVKLGQ
jgi:cold shock CspA family protein